MKSNHKIILGITICQTGLHILQLKKQAKRHLIQNAITLPFDHQISLENPQALTTAIKDCIKKNNITAKNAILGIPTKWTITKEKQIPASNKQDALHILNLQASTDFSVNPQSLLIDYAGTITDKKTSNLLLVAGQKSKIQNITQILADAGIKVSAILPTTLALAAGNDKTIINITNADVELATPTQYQYHNIQHIPAKPLPQNPNGQLLTWSNSITDQINRSNALIPNKKTNIQISATQSLPQSALNQLSTNTQRTIDAPRIENIYNIAPQIDTPPSHAAAHIAAFAFTPKTLPLNLIESKIILRKQTSSSQQKNLLVAASVICMITLALLINNFIQSSNAQAIQNEIDQNAVAAADATKLIAKTKLADQWHNNRPSPINAIHAITQILSTSPNIYIKSIDIKEKNIISIKGSALTDNDIDALSNKLNESKKFTKTDPGNRTPDPKSKRQTFDIECQYTGK